MKNKSSFWIIFTSIVLAFLLSVFFGNFTASKLAGMSFFNNWKIFRPEAPIVITTREVVTSPGSQNSIDASVAAKTRLSVVVSSDNGQVTVTGGAVNITSDGLFAAPAGDFPPQFQKYSVVLSDGRISAVNQKTTDPATGLVLFRTGIQNVPVAPLGNSEQLSSGDTVVLLMNSLQAYMTKAELSRINVIQDDVEHIVFNADKSSRTFIIQSTNVPLGSAAIDSGGDVVGIWNGSSIVSSDVLQQAIKLFLSSSSGFIRPQFGFSYSLVTSADSQLLGLPEGALVTNVVKPLKNAGPLTGAYNAKLQDGDIITAINSSPVDEKNLPEAMLEQFKPGDIISLTVKRAKDTINLELIVGQQ